MRYWLHNVADRRDREWAHATEERALRLYAQWIIDGKPRVSMIVLCSQEAGALYVGAELRRRALAYLTQDALIAFLADFPVEHLYRASASDGTPHFTIVTEAISHEREREIFAFHFLPEIHDDLDRSCDLLVVNPGIFDIPAGETFVYTPHTGEVEITLPIRISAVNAVDFIAIDSATRVPGGKDDAVNDPRLKPEACPQPLVKSGLRRALTDPHYSEEQ
jgi:hypothetical protein